MGRPEFSDPGSGFYGVRFVEADSGVAAGSTYSVYTYPTRDDVLRSDTIRLEAPAPSGATSGVHGFEIWSLNSLMTAKIEADYQNPIRYQNFEPHSVDRYYPADREALMEAIRRTYGKTGSNHHVIYYNDTDASQDGTVTFEIQTVGETTA